MPRYFFNVRFPDGYATDREGAVLPDIEAGKREADLSAREILADALQGRGIVDGQVFEVTNENGTIVLEYPLRNSLRLG